MLSLPTFPFVRIIIYIQIAWCLPDTAKAVVNYIRLNMEFNFKQTAKLSLIFTITSLLRLEKKKKKKKEEKKHIFLTLCIIVTSQCVNIGTLALTNDLAHIAFKYMRCCWLNSLTRMWKKRRQPEMYEQICSQNWPSGLK